MLSLWFSHRKGLKDVKVYNNTCYFGKEKGKRIFVEGGRERIPIETEFRNNIFYFEDNAEWGFEPDETCVFENNLFHNLSPKGKNAVSGNPQFANPGSGGNDIDMSDPQRLSGYSLKQSSPAINSGKIIDKNGSVDFIGNSLDGNPDSGAFEKKRTNFYG